MEVPREGLRQVAEGEDKVIGGWLLYGAALNEGRKMFPSNNMFHDWKVSSQLATASRDDEAAAMWAAGNRDDFREMRRLHPKVRNVRGGGETKMPHSLTCKNQTRMLFRANHRR